MRRALRGGADVTWVKGIEGALLLFYRRGDCVLYRASGVWHFHSAPTGLLVLANAKNASVDEVMGRVELIVRSVEAS